MPARARGNLSRASIYTRRVLARRATRATAAAAGIAVSAAFGYLAVRDVDWGRFRDAIADGDLRWLLPAAAVLAVGILLRALRWQLLFARETRPPLGPTLRALLVGTFFNIVFPGRAGEAIRVVYLHEETRTSRVEALGTAVTERVYDVVVLLVLLFATMPWLPDAAWLRRALLAAAVVAGCVLLAVLVLVRWQSRGLLFLLRPLRRLPGVSEPRIEETARNLFVGLVAMRRAAVAVPALALSIVSILVIAASFWLTMQALRLELPFSAAVLVMVATNLAMVTPSSPAAVGVFEAATLAALHPFGVDASHGLSYAVVLHALNVLPFVAIGLVLVQRHALRIARRGGRAPEPAG